MTGVPSNGGVSVVVAPSRTMPRPLHRISHATLSRKEAFLPTLSSSGNTPSLPSTSLDVLKQSTTHA